MVAVSAASGARSYLAPRLRPKHLKMATIAIVALGLLGSTIAFSGSSPAQASPNGPAHTAGR